MNMYEERTGGTPSVSCQMCSGGDITALAFGPSASHRIYYASGHSVHQGDVRMLAPNSHVHSYSFHQDDVSSISINQRGTYLVSGDDSGMVRSNTCSWGKEIICRHDWFPRQPEFQCAVQYDPDHPDY